MEYGKSATGNDFGFILTGPTRKLHLKAKDFFDFVLTYESLKLALSSSNYAGIHNHDSFAPERNNAVCEWFIDGNDYFSNLCDELLSAKDDIFISGWWVSPELYLKRPVGLAHNKEFRLDNVLKKKAD